jgi:hypothetical protein
MRPGGGVGLGASSPELEAYYNAVAQEDARLAAGAQQEGRAQTAFGANLFGTAGNLLTQGYGGQVSALSPYQAYLQGATGLEALGQDPLNIGSALGGKVANPTGGSFLLQGNMSAAGTQARADAYNPFAQLLMQGSQNPNLQRGLSNAFGNTNSMGNSIYNPATMSGGFAGTPLSSFFYGTGGSGD